MAAIYLIRHGQASLGSANYDALSDKGFQQASVLGESLLQRGIEFDAVYSGTMRRHLETTEYCLKAMDCTIAPTFMSGFNEFNHEELIARQLELLPDKLQLEQTTKDDPNFPRTFQQIFEQAVTRWRSGEHDGDYSETWNQFRNRCNESIEKIRRTQNKSIAVFTSGGPIAAITSHVLRLTDEQMVSLNWAVMNCSISCLLFNAEKISLRFFNDFAHFEARADKSLLTHR